MSRVDRKLIFKWRGGTLATLAVLAIFFGRPTPDSLFLGGLLGLLGESLRFWAIGFSGGPTRGMVLDAPLLVTAGPYAHLRNPLYLGNLLNGMGIAVAGSGGLDRGWAGLALLASALILWAVYRTIIGLEEEFLSQSFGDKFTTYCRQVPRLLPRLSPAGPMEGSFSLDKALYFEKWTLFWFWLVWTLLCLKVPHGGLPAFTAQG